MPNVCDINGGSLVLWNSVKQSPIWLIFTSKCAEWSNAGTPSVFWKQNTFYKQCKGVFESLQNDLVWHFVQRMYPHILKNIVSEPILDGHLHHSTSKGRVTFVQLSCTYISTLITCTFKSGHPFITVFLKSTYHNKI